MTIPRSLQIDLASTTYYHCISRCVRRAFLCGKDYDSGQDFNHRKQWIVERMKWLSNIFAIKICAYAMMSNHYHMVLYVDVERVEAMTDADIFKRWAQLCPLDVKSYRQKPPTDILLQQKLALWRERLCSISWFMKYINEYIARRSNREDGCKGRFWESRFKSQALLDEGAILAAMVYVDLNPIRAGIVDQPEEAIFTSIYERIQAVSAQASTKPSNGSKYRLEDKMALQQPPTLMPFMISNISKAQEPVIEYALLDYMQLVDYSGRMIRDGKIGKIPESCQPILDRLKLTQAGWHKLVTDLESSFSFAVGELELLSRFGPTKRLGSPRGVSVAKCCYVNEAH